MKRKLLAFFAQKIEEKGNKDSGKQQFVDSQLDPVVSKINHLSSLQPIIQKITDNSKFNIITMALLKSSEPVKNVTADMPNNTWDTEIQIFAMYDVSLLESFGAIQEGYQDGIVFAIPTPDAQAIQFD